MTVWWTSIRGLWRAARDPDDELPKVLDGCESESEDEPKGHQSLPVRGSASVVVAVVVAVVVVGARIDKQWSVRCAVHAGSLAASLWASAWRLAASPNGDSSIHKLTVTNYMPTPAPFFLTLFLTPLTLLTLSQGGGRPSAASVRTCLLTDQYHALSSAGGRLLEVPSTAGQAGVEQTEGAEDAKPASRTAVVGCVRTTIRHLPTSAHKRMSHLHPPLRPVHQNELLHPIPCRVG